ncbi:MAG TPA: HAD family hydrolase [Candidatus Xenobia bacterium]
MTLVLFDIDQTLMESGGVGMRCLKAAARETLGIDAFEGVHPDGKTDPQILAEGLSIHGLGEADFKHVIARYIELLRDELGRPDPRRRLKPGVQALLDALSANTALGLLTGNLQTTAHLKLQALRIEPYFPIGAYGSDAAVRTHLGPVALQRARAHYGRTFDTVWVIGDTPMDIEAGRAIAAHTLAVATGSHTVEALQRAKADAALPDLSDTAQVLQILGVAGPARFC